MKLALASVALPALHLSASVRAVSARCFLPARTVAATRNCTVIAAPHVTRYRWLRVFASDVPCFAAVIVNFVAGPATDEMETGEGLDDFASVLVVVVEAVLVLVWLESLPEASLLTAVHEDAPAGECVPAGHGVAAVAAPVAYVSSGVVVQLIDSVTGAKVPTGHGIAMLAPMADT